MRRGRRSGRYTVSRDPRDWTLRASVKSSCTHIDVVFATHRERVVFVHVYLYFIIDITRRGGLFLRPSRD